MLKPCILKINDLVYYVPEEILLKVPYFQIMYSNKFSDVLNDVDDITMRKFEIKEFNIFCKEGIMILIKLLNNHDDTRMYDSMNYYNIEEHPIDHILQFLQLCDYFQIDYGIENCLKIYFNDNTYEFIICDEPSISLDEYVLQLSEKQKNVATFLTYTKQNPTTDNMENIYPGFRERFIEIKSIMLKYFNWSHHDEFSYFSSFTADYIFRNINYPNIIMNGRSIKVICIYLKQSDFNKIRINEKYNYRRYSENSNILKFIYLDDEYIIYNYHDSVKKCSKYKILDSDYIFDEYQDVKDQITWTYSSLSE